MPALQIGSWELARLEGEEKRFDCRGRSFFVCGDVCVCHGKFVGMKVDVLHVQLLRS